MHTGINCIRAQQSRRGTIQLRWWGCSGKNYAQEGCHPKNEDIEAHSNAKEHLKVQRRTILYNFVHLILIGYVSIMSSERSNDGFTASISARALIIWFPVAGSLAHAGTRPHWQSATLRTPSA